jgi:hypothetical protein
MPCNPLDVNIQPPNGPSGPPIPGFGVPFSLPTPNIAPFLDGFPEDLLALLDQLQLLIPPGALKPQLNPNFGKDVFDGIMKLLDQFMPFLMLYKFFLPILNLIICIIEVLCAIPNPFKLIKAMKRLFRNCIPEFLNLFPIFALIIMIISLLLLLLALIEYIIAQILKFIEMILRNINALVKAFSEGDSNSVLAIASKLGALLCIFQNLFVLLSIFNIIIQVIKDILSLVFKIPPCDNKSNSDEDGCCTTDVCPAIVQTDYTRITGQLQYLRSLGLQPTTPFPGLPNFSTTVRSESWTIYDPNQEIQQAFINIVDAYDVAPGSGTSLFGITTKPIFFPTDTNYTADTSPTQAAYTIDLRVFYNPTNWGRAQTAATAPNQTVSIVGQPRYVRFKNVIVSKAPTRTLTLNDGSHQTINDGTLLLVGGAGYEDDDSTVLLGFDDDGVTQIGDQATLENFFHKPERFSTFGTITPDTTDGYTFNDITYTFRPNLETLLRKQLITLGCEPSLALNRDFINTAFGGDINFKTQLLGDLVNGRGGNTFPDPAGAQQCLEAALLALRSNLTTAGVAQFQATTTACLNKLKDDTNSALSSLVGIGFEACSSDFSLTPKIQFTSRPITVKVDLKERNGLPLTTGISPDVAVNIAARIKGHPTFGTIGNFIYDGYQSFTAPLNSDIAGTGEISVSFDNNIFCTNSIPADNDVAPSHDLKVLDYQFIYSGGTTVSTTGDTDGQPRRDEGDVSRTNNLGGGKDGV